MFGAENAHSSVSAWPSELENHRVDVYLRDENVAHVDDRRRLGDTRDLVEIFMQDPKDTDSNLPQVRLLQHFMNGRTLRTIRPGEAQDGSAPFFNAWLDERGFENGVASSRAYRGLLTAGDLHRELGKPRFWVQGQSKNGSSVSLSTQSSQSSQSSRHPRWKMRSRLRRALHVRLGTGTGSQTASKSHLPTTEPSETCAREPDAARRLVYYTDLDSQGAAALMETASNSQAHALRDALYKHISGQAFIGVKLPSKGFSRFEIAFHLPFFVWRHVQSLREDHRRCADGQPLRRSTNVSFLDRKSDQITQVLCEAHVSCVISGLDDLRWVAYCFVDTYFDGESGARETVLEWNSDKNEEDGMNADPLTYGNVDADKPIWNPRVYFLEVLQRRLNQVKREWTDVVEYVEQSFGAFEETESYLYPAERHETLDLDDAESSESLRTSFNWVTKVLLLSTKLKGVLSNSVRASEDFLQKNAVYFEEFESSTRAHKSLLAIQTTIQELQEFKRRFEYLVTRCGYLARILDSRINLESVNASRKQGQLAKDNKGFSWIMVLYVSPVALTTSIFSMQTNLLPLVQPTFAWFVGLIFLFILIAAGVHRMHPIIFCYWQTATTSCWKFCVSTVNTGRICRKKNPSLDIENDIRSSPMVAAEDDGLNVTVQAVRMTTFSSMVSAFRPAASLQGAT